MAYDKLRIFEKAKEVIQKYHLIFIEEISAFIGISKTTFYDFFPAESEEMNVLKDMILTERTSMKTSIRSKLYKNNKDAGLLALYKLICTDEERRALSLTFTENSTTINERKTLAELFPPDDELIIK